MKVDFYIIEDDNSVVKMLKNIINEYNLGYLAGYSCDSEEIINQINDMKPDIILVDFLMPFVDGLEIIRKIKNSGYDGKYIMISEVTAKTVISQAYKLGVEYYINKPINVIEVVTVIEKVTNLIKTEKIIDLIGLKNIQPKKSKNINHIRNINQIYSDLGIIGKSGIKDLNESIIKIIEEKEKNPKYSYNLYDIYDYITNEYKRMDVDISTKTVEQRLRRLVITAMENIASLGIEDFSNFKFERYSTSLFSYKDIKAEMDYLRGKSKYRGKINIKKFIEGIVMFC